MKYQAVDFKPIIHKINYKCQFKKTSQINPSLYENNFKLTDPQNQQNLKRIIGHYLYNLIRKY